MALVAISNAKLDVFGDRVVAVVVCLKDIDELLLLLPAEVLIRLECLLVGRLHC